MKIFKKEIRIPPIYIVINGYIWLGIDGWLNDKDHANQVRLYLPCLYFASYWGATTPSGLSLNDTEFKVGLSHMCDHFNIM